MVGSRAGSSAALDLQPTENAIADAMQSSEVVWHMPIHGPAQRDPFNRASPLRRIQFGDMDRQFETVAICTTAPRSDSTLSQLLGDTNGPEC